MTEISSMPYLLLLGLIAVLPSISEEVTIRGIVLSGYEEKINILQCCYRIVLESSI